MALQMKKIWLSSLAVVGLGLGLVAAVPALAAGSSSSSGSSSPSATLTPKDSQATTVFTTTNPSLTLSKVPNIDFGSNATPNGSTDLSVQAARSRLRSRSGQRWDCQWLERSGNEFGIYGFGYQQFAIWREAIICGGWGSPG